MEPFTVHREFENLRRRLIQFVTILTVFIGRPYGERFIIETGKGVGSSPYSMNIVTVLLSTRLIPSCQGTGIFSGEGLPYSGALRDDRCALHIQKKVFIALYNPTNCYRIITVIGYCKQLRIVH